MDENDELNELLAETINHPRAVSQDDYDYYEETESGNRINLQEATQWTSPNKHTFIPSCPSTGSIPAGAYTIEFSNSTGLYFNKVNIKTENILQLPEKNVERIISEVKAFWQKKELFEKHGLQYKRGIFMWGPPGSGKTCAIQFCCKQLIEDFGGIIIRFTDANLFVDGMRAFRRIEPERPIIVVMEDMEDIMKSTHESIVLNAIDGGEHLDNVVFLATSNYPGQLGPRIINRPSRFDKRFKVDFPNPDSRRMYLEHMDIGNNIPDMDKWVRDTDRFSMAHLKELFTAVIILDDEYSEAVNNLTKMRERILEDDEFVTEKVGFGT